ncbi:hypothetical protein B5X24_HaOG216716 [Helicoverpa armigera]|nr:hypothetical protein B5X24_HaOG216716 [Helicoverpa armigera]
MVAESFYAFALNINADPLISSETTNLYKIRRYSDKKRWLLPDKSHAFIRNRASFIKKSGVMAEGISRWTNSPQP